MKLLAIVPAFNEEGAVADVIAEIRRAEPDADVLVVDDGSHDATAEVAHAAGARVARLPFNLGIGGAVQTGFRVAWDEGYDVAVQVDGDGQHPAEAIPRLVAAIEEGQADYVVGSRFVEDTGYQAPRPRRMGMVILSALVSRIVGHPMTDTTSGFRAAGRRAIEVFAAHYPHDYPEVEATVIAARGGLRVLEVPVEMRPRTAGRSSINAVQSAYYMVKVILAVGVQCLGRRYRPEERPA
jgi:glycosyltransferase involved in cell wall biosynthesis